MYGNLQIEIIWTQNKLCNLAIHMAIDWLQSSDLWLPVEWSNMNTQSIISIDSLYFVYQHTKAEIK